MRSRLIIATSALAATLVSGGWLLQRGTTESANAYDGARLFREVFEHVQRFYVDTVTAPELYRHAAEGMLRELNDPHSVYLTPERLRRLSEGTTGNYGGIGVQIDVRGGWIMVVAPLPDTPGERAGIQTGDRIVEIEGKTTYGWTVEEAARALRGEPGTPVKFVVERPGLPDRIPFEIRRQDIHVRSIRVSTMLNDEVGYVELNPFSERAAEELRDAVIGLERRGMQQLIIDLRNNPGGLLDQGVAVTDLFLSPGQEIVSMRGRTPDANRTFTDREPQPWPELPLLVLIDSGSASASEIFAGALQDHDRAVLLGTSTFGKGSAQSLFQMPGGGALKLTTALWYTPVGRSINRPPDVELYADAADMPSEGDEAERAEVLGDTLYRTAMGRVVYGGGGITPDVIVPEAELSPEAIRFFEALGSDAPKFLDALTEYAIALRGTGTIQSPNFTVTSAMLDELWRRLRAKGVTVDRELYAAARPRIGRELAVAIGRYTLAGDNEFLVRARFDDTIREALRLAEGAATPRELIARVEQGSSRGPVPAVRSDTSGT